MSTNPTTQTPSFGTVARVNHDSSAFYGLKMLGDFKNVVSLGQNQILEEKLVNRFYHQDAQNMIGLPDNTVHLMITSPPYGVGKDYDKDLSFAEYRQMLKNVWRETFRVLVNGGRACINVANLGRKPYTPIHSFIIEDCLEIGFQMRGEIIWQKGTTSGSVAWGSWKSAKNPVLRDMHEYILIFTKGEFGRLEKGESDITGDEFMQYTQSIWNIPPESAKRIGHPAPFPVELPARLIKLYSYKDDIVLDPFVGSGTTCLAAQNLNRQWIGFDTEEDYLNIAEKRLNSGNYSLI